MVHSIEIAGAVLRIDLDALVANYKRICMQVDGATVAGVVKANAYGLGAAEVSHALASAGCRHFFVAQLGEAIALRPKLGDEAALYVLNGLKPGAEAVAAGINAIPVLNSRDQLDRWAALAAGSGRRLPAVLQVDSGMSRLGLSRAEASALASNPEQLDGIELRLIMSHLACADDAEAEANRAQATAFEEMASLFPGIPRALDNSGGSFLPRSHFDIVRPGIALYGGAPQGGRPNPMRPVVALETYIIQVRDVPAGVGVGYGLTSVASHARRIATLPVGYADGWPRHLSNRGAVFIGGHRAPVAGRVSMDSMTVDVTDVPAALLQPGAPVELLGPHQCIDDVARDAGTISYEILTQLGHRYARTYLPVQDSAASGRLPA